MVVYHIPPGFTPTVTAHGNSKSTKPYFPTLPSTYHNIKKECCVHEPKEVVSKMERSAGGIIETTYPGEVPTTNFQLQASCPQEYWTESITAGSIMLQANMEGTNVRDVKAYPEPAIVFSSLSMLKGFAASLHSLC